MYHRIIVIQNKTGESQHTVTSDEFIIAKDRTGNNHKIPLAKFERMYYNKEKGKEGAQCRRIFVR